MTHALIIAASSNTAWWLFAAQMLCNVLFAVFMFAMRRKFSETDKLREKVEERDEIIRAQVKQEVDHRLGAIEEAVKELVQRDHQAELKLQDEVHQLRLYVTQHCATKSGMVELSNKVIALREDVIRVEKERGAA